MSDIGVYSAKQVLWLVAQSSLMEKFANTPAEDELGLPCFRTSLWNAAATMRGLDYRPALIQRQELLADRRRRLAVAKAEREGLIALGLARRDQAHAELTARAEEVAELLADEAQSWLDSDRGY
jgi:hypothetical protein